MKMYRGIFSLLALVLATLGVNAASPGGVVAWGDNGYGQTDVPEEAQSGVMAVEAGGFHTVALKTNGTVVAWGYNGYGQTNVPDEVQGGVMAIAAGGYHTVVLEADGTVVAWGFDAYGQTDVPEAAQDGVKAIAAGIYHTVALKTNGMVVAWGDNRYGQTTVPDSLQSGVRAIAAGDYHTVALKNDGTVVAWGNNFYGQTNVPATAKSGVVAVAAGLYHTVVLKTNGTVVAWGFNDYGQTNVPATAKSGVMAIAAGIYNTVALKTNGTVVVWGSSGYGQTTVPGAAQSGVVAIAAGGHHTAAIVKAMASLTLGNLNQTYNGTARCVTAATEPTNLTVVLTYNGSVNAPTNAGTYTVIGTINDLIYQGTKPEILTISKAGAVVNLGNLLQTYDGKPKQATAATIPPGLKVDMTYNGFNCAPACAPTEVGSYTVTGTINDLNYQGSKTDTLTIRVGVPAITKQPVGQVLTAGSNVTLSVVAQGAYLDYQWFKDGVAIPNATRTNLIFNPVALSDAGVYWVVVSNTAGSVTSTNAVLAVRPPGAPLIRVGGQAVEGGITNVYSATITMTGGYTNGIIYYTLDGSTPTTGSSIYSSPIVATNTVVVRALGLNVNTFETAEAPAVTVQILYPVRAITAGGGTVGVSPAQTASAYISNSTVIVTATASNGWRFLRWAGDAIGTNNPLSLNIIRSNYVAAIFETPVVASEIGSGRIELNAPHPVPYGTLVRATAIASNGNYFAQWGGALTGTNSPAIFPVTSTNPVRAVFVTLPTNQVALSVRIVGPGNVGEVVVNPRKQYYTVGENVTLTAVLPPGTNDHFYGWSGDVASTNNPLVLTLNTSKVVTANFSPHVPPLAMTRQGSHVQLSWSSAYGDFILLSSGAQTGGIWTTNNSPQTISASNITVTLPATNSQMFYRLTTKP